MVSHTEDITCVEVNINPDILPFQVQHQEIIVSTTCPPANGTAVLADNLMLPAHHVLDSTDIEGATMVALLITAVIFFVLTFIVFVANTRKWFQSSRKSNRNQ